MNVMSYANRVIVDQIRVLPGGGVGATPEFDPCLGHLRIDGGHCLTGYLALVTRLIRQYLRPGEPVSKKSNTEL